MGLFDFFQKGEQKPADKPAQPVGTTPDFLKTGQPGASAAPAGDKYTVKSGDSLSKIAKAHYGDAMQWKHVYEANKALIGANPDMIQPGQELVLPKL
ncbi:MAG: LysM peptidoglycan-binding domain-containing protein [Hymenobacteraceae bacterium]|nr:LysM peptidoglycan-binding domain-containing protein [Hymenobacteraceae bacterium]